MTNLRLRPYKSCDADKIISWIKDADTFHKWGGDHFGKFPIDASVIDNKYMKNNGDCIENDNFYCQKKSEGEFSLIGVPEIFLLTNICPQQDKIKIDNMAYMP